MAPRAYWKGYLKLSLVSCPIALYPASSSSERVSFNRINKKTGNRLKQQMVDAETGEPVDKEDIGRGYEIGKGQYLQVEDEELEKIKIESTHTIEIDSFVPRAEIDDRYLDSPYYIAPTDQVGQEAFAVIRDAIRDKRMVGARPRRADAPRACRDARGVRQGPAGDDAALRLRGARQAAYFEDIPELKLPAEMKQLAAHIVDTKATHFDPKKFEDHYENALVELLRAKQAGRAIEPVRGGRRAPQRVINLMDALRASIGAETRRSRRRPAPRLGPAPALPAKRKTGTLTQNAEPDRAALEGTVAFTGRLASMKRADAFALVRKHGGKPREGVTKQTDVLIVGELGWPLLDDGRPSNSLAQAKSYGFRSPASGSSSNGSDKSDPGRAGQDLHGRPDCLA